MQQPPFSLLPATCELCGNWLPNHQTSCPRNGVHPSQWTMTTLLIVDVDSNNDSFDSFDSIPQDSDQDDV
ncbi:hypothetical protein BDB00DRAFT_754604 [Zychaea mexicana]|uniref:uncharacterized protein n=1 Tax=Zychaea mexicana TaxID=64656 RepID=UPI0022FED3A8|nr:uncharacterized protein BDB00DRAFT_754604 [Zychaea mexicana]KAI9498715.1 hypothetical protein BDB00DRAFT_754604 [Zychaea mexicana]